jgi:hypothetical protein
MRGPTATSLYSGHPLATIRITPPIKNVVPEYLAYYLQDRIHIGLNTSGLKKTPPASRPLEGV